MEPLYRSVLPSKYYNMYNEYNECNKYNEFALHILYMFT